MPYYVSVTSANPAEDHESGFVTQQAAQEYAKDLLAVYRQRLDRDRQHRRSEKDQIAAMVALLAPEWAGWITGQTISVSGGFSMV